MPARRYLWGGMPMREHARVCQSTSEYEGARQGIVDHDILGVSARHYQWGDLPMREHARVCQSTSEDEGACKGVHGTYIMMYNRYRYICILQGAICGVRCQCEGMPIETSIWNGVPICQGLGYTLEVLYFNLMRQYGFEQDTLVWCFSVTGYARDRYLVWCFNVPRKEYGTYWQNAPMPEYMPPVIQMWRCP